MIDRESKINFAISTYGFIPDADYSSLSWMVFPNMRKRDDGGN